MHSLSTKNVLKLCLTTGLKTCKTVINSITLELQLKAEIW